LEGNFCLVGGEERCRGVGRGTFVTIIIFYVVEKYHTILVTMLMSIADAVVSVFVFVANSVGNDVVASLLRS